MLSGNSLRQIVHTYCAFVHQAAKLVAALLRVEGVTAGLSESNGSLPPGLWLTSPAGLLPRTGISSGTLRFVIKYGLPPFLPVLVHRCIRLDLRLYVCTSCMHLSTTWVLMGLCAGFWVQHGSGPSRAWCFFLAIAYFLFKFRVGSYLHLFVWNNHLLDFGSLEITSLQMI